MDKKEYIRRLATFLHDNGTTMAVTELAEHLNRNNFKTGYGSEYEGGRGTYTLIHATYRRNPRCLFNTGYSRYRALFSRKTFIQDNSP